MVKHLIILAKTEEQTEMYALITRHVQHVLVLIFFIVEVVRSVVPQIL